LPLHSFPLEHRRQIWSTNALERLNREVGRHCEVVGIFPNRPSLLRLVGAVLEEQNDEWAVGRRYFSQESMHKLLEPTPEEVVQALLELQTA
jgi:transposase-like protein